MIVTILLDLLLVLALVLATCLTSVKGGGIGPESRAEEPILPNDLLAALYPRGAREPDAVFDFL